MSLDESKLENLRESSNKKIARCPACAAEGQDKKGEHLVIYPDGKYGCVAHQEDKEHRKEIFRFAGNAQKYGRGGAAMKIKLEVHPDWHKWESEKGTLYEK